MLLLVLTNFWVSFQRDRCNFYIKKYKRKLDAPQKQIFEDKSHVSIIEPNTRAFYKLTSIVWGVYNNYLIDLKFP